MKLSMWSAYYIDLSPEEAVLELEKNGYAYSELSDEEKSAGLNRSILLGGRYASTDSESGEVTYSGLEENRTYAVSVQTYKNMEDGSKLLSTVILTEKLQMTAPVKTAISTR